MKKIILITIVNMLSTFGIAQTTATNFNVNDCSGTNHDLFTELNAGKVVVIVWVMPCASCIGPALSAYTQVQTYSTSHPGRVIYYLVDDVANTSCATLTSWGNTNGITGVPTFSNAAISMTDYGTAGMPKTVVLAGTNHDVLFNQNNGLNVTNFNNAIALGLTTGINEISTSDFQMSLFPNPVSNNKTTVKYNLVENSDINISIYNTLGANVKNVLLEKQSAGKHESILNLDTLDGGIYFIKISDGNKSQTIKFTVSH